LKFPFIVHDYPPNFLKYLPKFNGEDHERVEKHMDAFERFTYILEIMHEDVFMRAL